MPLSYQPRHRALLDLPDDCFAPPLLSALGDRSGEALDGLVEQVHPGIVVFPLFSRAFCQALRDEARRFEAFCQQHKRPIVRPNSMNNYGVVLADLGLEDTLDRLVERMLPLTARFFADRGGSDLDHQHSFLVDYALDGDTELGFHVDDSEVTLNACLGSAFEGGEVYFRGERCAQHRQTQALDREHHDLAHRAGYGALHAGAHRHGVRPLRSGQRTNLIVWMRSSRLRRLAAAGCQPWCGARG